jgi:undecaprenyl-diphosphatase
MDIIQAFVLGIVQGLTEFIPVSSSAHLVLIPKFLGWTQPPMSFNVFLHGGTLVALLIFFWADVVKYVKAFFVGTSMFIRSIFVKDYQNTFLPDTILSYNIILTLVPTGFLGLLFKDRLEQAFQDPKLVAWLLLGTAALLILSSVLKGKRELEEINWLDVLVVGFMQAVAMFPGISRSGATIAGGRIMGLNRETSARFTFLIAIPAIGAAFLLSLWDVLKGDVPIFLIPSIIGFVVSAIVGYFSFHLFFKIVKKFGFQAFAVYCILLFLVAQFLI